MGNRRLTSTEPQIDEQGTAEVGSSEIDEWGTGGLTSTEPQIDEQGTAER